MKYEVYVRPDPLSSASNTMINDVVRQLEKRAREDGHTHEQGEGPGFRIYVVGNQQAPTRERPANGFFVNCRAMHDDDGTYQEPPSCRYAVSWSDDAREWVQDAVAIHDQPGVLAVFDEFLDALLPSAEHETRLIEIGMDRARPLKLRRRALARVRQTDVDPWPPGLQEAYASVLSDATLSVLDRIEVAEDCSAYDDPLREKRHALLFEASSIEGLTPSVELRIARELGGTSGLERLVRLARSDDQKVAKDAPTVWGGSHAPSASRCQ